MSLWHALRREAAGALRSVRYDLDTRRAAKLANAFTEEFHAATDEPLSRRAIPLIGVAMLLAGGVAGTALAISGGLAALGADRPVPAVQQPAAAPAGTPAALSAATATDGVRALTPGQPARRPKRPLQSTAVPESAPTRAPQPESSTVATPTPTASPSESRTPPPSPSAAGYP